MGHGEENGLLMIAEVVHWAALAFMGIVYAARIIWLLSFKNAKDKSQPGTLGNTGMGPAIYSLGNVAMPWAMESTRQGFGFYLSFALFHIGVTVGITVAFVSSLYMPLLEISIVSYAFMASMGIAFLISLYRIVRRVAVPHMKLISTPDDYFALLTLATWFALGVLAQAHFGHVVDNVAFHTAYLFMTSFFLIYVPFSKISHYLYYPFTRWWLGKALGHRGSMPVARG